ncbi:MAG: nuclear transport factor 2 family protein [Myxococcota bacterium]
MLPDSLASRTRRFYERLSAERDPIIDLLPEIYTEDIHFVDPFRDTVGLPALRELFVRMLKQYPEVRFTNYRALGDDAGFTLIYDMELKMPVGPFFKTEIASVCFTRDGKISELRDYYDFPSSLVSPFGPLRRLYGGIIRALFL